LATEPAPGPAQITTAPADAPATARLRVLCVDARPLVRAGLAGLARTALGCRAQAVADLGQAATAVRFGGRDPDVVVIGLVPGDDPATSVRAARRFGAPVICALHSADPGAALAALAAGADGYLALDVADADRLRATIAAAREGATVVPPELRRHRHAARRGGVTVRGLEVLRALAEGLHDDEIAARLAISVSSVRKHLAASQERLDARTRTQLVAIAARSGLL
jgi:DNA-binding NarL/FixJ family response regulator